jgi:hypothetical protein
MLTMNSDEIAAYLVQRLHEVQERLGLPPAGNGSARFADVIDSMGFVEFIGQVADDCGVEPENIERAAGRRFSTVTALAEALHSAGLSPRAAAAESQAIATQKVDVPGSPGTATTAFLASVAVRLPVVRQSAEQIDVLLD